MRPREATIVPPEHRATAASVAAAMGYPRLIEPDEIDGSEWFFWGTVAVFWLQHRGEADPARELVLHLVVAPPFRARVYARPWLRWVVQWARVMRYDRLRFLGDRHDPVASYLRRWGWTEDHESLRLELGGSHEEAEESERPVPPARRHRSAARARA